jgi:hypothetical protein
MLRTKENIINKQIVSGSMIHVESYETMEADRLRGLTIFRDLLLADLTSLLNKIQELEHKLLGRKQQYQMFDLIPHELLTETERATILTHTRAPFRTRRIHCGLGLGLVGMSARWFKPLILTSSYDHYFQSYRSEIRRICTIFAAIGVYTLYALHSAHRYKKAVASTSNMRKEIARFVRRVEEKEPLVDKDIECLKGAKWDQVPWKEVETEPSWKLMSGL